MVDKGGGLVCPWVDLLEICQVSDFHAGAGKPILFARFSMMVAKLNRSGAVVVVMGCALVTWGVLK